MTTKVRWPWELFMFWLSLAFCAYTALALEIRWWERLMLTVVGLMMIFAIFKLANYQLKINELQRMSIKTSASFNLLYKDCFRHREDDKDLFISFEKVRNQIFDVSDKLQDMR